MGKTIYDIGEDTPFKKWIKKQHKIHHNLKSLFMVPLLLFSEKIFNKYLAKGVPDKPHYRDIKVFNVAFEEAINVWCDTFRARINKTNLKYHKLMFEKYKHDKAVKCLRIMKRIILTICLNDTAYFEFTNILLHLLTIMMNNEYKDSEIRHLFYTAKHISDVHYFNCIANIQTGKLDQMPDGKFKFTLAPTYIVEKIPVTFNEEFKAKLKNPLAKRKYVKRKKK